MSRSDVSFDQVRKIVVKIGSALLTERGTGLVLSRIAAIAAQLTHVLEQDCQVVLVSSGAVAEGCNRLGWSSRPDTVHELQAAAAVGQIGLAEAWEGALKKHGTGAAMIMLTHEDLADRQRYLNARATIQQLLQLGVVPIINENDTVATEEIQLGDNDSLAGLVTNLLEADLLVILTDQPGLFDADPRKNKDAKLIAEARAGDSTLEQYAGTGGMLGRGGMQTKLQAARTAAKSGADTIIASGLESEVLTRIAAGEALGTLLTAEQAPIAARKQWLAGQTQTRGKLVLDDGAVKVLVKQGKSLLAVGVARVEGNFKRGEIVSCMNEAGVEIARGLVNYSKDEAELIRGEPSNRIETLLGYIDEAELIHRDNLILL